MSEFDRFAGNYRQILDSSLALAGDASEYFSHRKADYLSRLMGPAFAGKILDFGCGVGLLSRWLRGKFPGAQLHGFDVSADSLAAVPDELRRQGKFSADLAALDRDYDLIVVANVMHHIPPDQRDQTLTLLRERIAPTGRLVVIEHNPLNPLTRWVVATCPLDENAQLLWPAEVRRRGAAGGFAVRRKDYVTFFPSALAALAPVERWLAWLPLGGQYVTVLAPTPAT
jgi:trans-aconitate methyltransferase